MRSLDEKLAAFDAEVDVAIDYLRARLATRRKELKELARTRHAWGHDVYGDGNLFEWDDPQLEQERDEEVADAIVYETRRRNLHAENERRSRL